MRTIMNVLLVVLGEDDPTAVESAVVLALVILVSIAAVIILAFNVGATFHLLDGVSSVH